MLAFLGILVGENFHPLFGGNIDIPAAQHFTFTSYPVGGSVFWPAAYAQFIAASYFVEKSTSVPTIEGKFISGLNPNDSPETFAAKGGRIPGDLGFDPLGLKPKKKRAASTSEQGTSQRSPRDDRRHRCPDPGMVDWSESPSLVLKSF